MLRRFQTTDFCCAGDALSCAEARRAVSKHRVIQRPSRGFLMGDNLRQACVSRGLLTGGTKKNQTYQICDIWQRGIAPWRTRATQPHLIQNCLGFPGPSGGDRRVLWPTMPRKNPTTPASFVGKSRPQRARRRNSTFSRRPKRERVPQKWKVSRAISNER